MARPRDHGVMSGTLRRTASFRAPAAGRVHPRARRAAGARGRRRAPLSRRREVDARRLPRRRRVLRDQRLPDHEPAPRRLARAPTASGSGGSTCRRARRLLPALFLMMGVVVALRVALPSRRRSRSFAGQSIAAIFYVENWYLIFHKVSYFVSGRSPADAPARVVARGRGAVLPVLAVDPRVPALPVGTATNKLLAMHRRRRAASTVLMAVLYEPFTDPVTRLLRDRHACVHDVGRRGARDHLDTVAPHRATRRRARRCCSTGCRSSVPSV